MKLEEEFFKNKDTKTLLNEITELLISRDLTQKGAKGSKQKIRKSIRNFEEFGILQSHRIPQNPIRHARDISRTKKNLRIAVLNPDQQQIDSMVTPPKRISGSFLNLLAPPPQCSQIWGSSSSIKMEEESKQILSSSRIFFDEKFNDQKGNGLDKSFERKKDRAKTVQPRKSFLQLEREENNNNLY